MIGNDDGSASRRREEECDEGNPAYARPLPPSLLHSRGALPPATRCARPGGRCATARYHVPSPEGRQRRQPRRAPPLQAICIPGQGERNGGWALRSRRESWCLARLATRRLNASIGFSLSRSSPSSSSFSPLHVSVYNALKLQVDGANGRNAG